MSVLQFSRVGSVVWFAVLSSFLPAALSASGQTAPRPPSSAVATRTVEPEYTPEARAACLQGTVILYLEVNGEGDLARAEVIQSLGLGLDEKALEAVRQWRFKPATKDGEPVTVAQSAEVRFHLDLDLSWEIQRSGFRVNRPSSEPMSQLSLPLLTQYTSPAPEACPADGGAVIVDLQVTPKGQPDHLKLVEGPGDAASAAVLAAIRSWRFRPGFLNGKPRQGNGTVVLHCRAAQPVAAAFPASVAPAAPQRIGAGTSVPVPLYKIEPEYSVPARQAKIQGSVVLSMVVDASGLTRQISVLRPLGMGLDQQAMAAVSQWRFKPGMKDGKPVNIRTKVEVNFRLL